MSTPKADELSNAFGFITLNEVAAVHRLCQLLPPDPIAINIGAGVGTSGLTMLESRSDLTLFTIDARKEVDSQGALKNEQIALENAGYYDTTRYTQIHGDSKEVGKNWDKGKVNLVFIDGLHNYEQCTADILEWLPHIVEGGIIAAHDYALPWPQVRKAIDEQLVDKYEQILHMDSVIAFWVKHDV